MIPFDELFKMSREQTQCSISEQRRRTVARMNDKAKASEMALMNAIRATLNVIQGLRDLIPLMSAYTYEPRVPRDELDTLLEPYLKEKATWKVQQSSASGVYTIVPKTKAFVPWFDIAHIRFCRLFSFSAMVRKVLCSPLTESSETAALIHDDGVTVRVLTLYPSRPGLHCRVEVTNVSDGKTMLEEHVNEHGNAVACLDDGGEAEQESAIKRLAEQDRAPKRQRVN